MELENLKDLVERIKKNSPELLYITCYKCNEKKPCMHYKFERADGDNEFFEWICQPCLMSLEPVIRGLVKMQVVYYYNNAHGTSGACEFKL